MKQVCFADMSLVRWVMFKFSPLYKTSVYFWCFSLFSGINHRNSIKFYSMQIHFPLKYKSQPLLKPGEVATL